MKRALQGPGFAVAAIVLVALLTTVQLAVYGSDRMADAHRQAVASQEARLNSAALRIQDALTAMTQLSRTAVMVLAPSRSRAATINGIRRLHGAADRSLIYGVGLAFAPYAFDPGTNAFGVYGMTGTRGNTILQVVDSGRSQRYQRSRWFRIGRNAGERLTFIAPYPADHGPYAGVVQGFYANGHFAGCAIVAVKLTTMRALTEKLLVPGDRLSVGAPGGQILWNAGSETRAAPASIVITTTLRHARWTVELASAFTQTQAQRQTIILGVAFLMAGIWAIAGIAIGAILTTAFNRYHARRSRVESDTLRDMAHRDALTGLPNRTAALERINALIQTETHERPFVVFLIDLDRFALINDSLGHDVGDAILVMVAQRIAESLPAHAQFARLGGDEFVVSMELLDAELTAVETAQRIADNIRRPLLLDHHDVAITGSIGIVVSESQYRTAKAMLRDADIAMYAAKRGGTSPFVSFDKTMHDRAVARLSLEEKIRHAIHAGDFRAHYQPIIELASGRVSCVEALARWRGQAGLGVSPAEFIPAAEQSKLIGAIDRTILEQSCADARNLDEIEPGIAFSVNVSATLLSRGDLLQSISSTLERASLDPSRLKLELTETAFMEHPANALKILEGVRKLGAQVVIDDFGTGWSSLSYVQRLPISGIKIDRAFIAPIEFEPRCVAIVRAIVALARALGVDVTAEGIETAAQLRILKEAGVDYGQGWYFSKALAFDDLVTYIAANKASQVW